MSAVQRMDTTHSTKPSAESFIRRIAHLDMDAFYASVELLRYPQLKGLPVVIGGSRRREDDYLERLRAIDPIRDWENTPLSEYPLEVFPQIKDYTGRGVITTATYAARQYGIGSAMGLMKAAALCPHAILLPVDFDQYRKYSREFKSVILEIAPVMQDRGIDEVYLDLTQVPGGQRAGGLAIARLLQKSIFQATQLTCSIGVAPNKLLAKMASEFNKPNGICVLLEEDLEQKIWPLACRKINGIGPKTEEKLRALGVLTIGELARFDPVQLSIHFGPKYARWLHDSANGRDDSPVTTYSEPVSLSRETTFERDMHASVDKERLTPILTRLCEQVASDLKRKGYMGKTVGIKIKYDNFKTVTRDQTLGEPTDEAKTIRRFAGELLRRVDLSRRFRLLGVRMGSLVKTNEWTQSQQEGHNQSTDVGLNQELF
jgi:DNA polymerase-4